MNYEEKLREELELVRCDLHNAYSILEGRNEEIEKLREHTSNQDRIIAEANNRIYKAIEYIKEHIRTDDEYPGYMDMLVEDYKELLEILDRSGVDKE